MVCHFTSSHTTNLRNRILRRPNPCAAGVVTHQLCYHAIAGHHETGDVSQENALVTVECRSCNRPDSDQRPADGALRSERVRRRYQAD